MWLKFVWDQSIVYMIGFDAYNYENACDRSQLGFVQSCYLHLWTMCRYTPESWFTCQQREVNRRWKLDWWAAASEFSFHVIDVGINRKPICNVLLVINTNLHSISYRFEVIAYYCSNFQRKMVTSHRFLEAPCEGLLATYNTRFILGLLKSLLWTFYSC